MEESSRHSISSWRVIKSDFLLYGHYSCKSSGSRPAGFRLPPSIRVNLFLLPKAFMMNSVSILIFLSVFAIKNINGNEYANACRFLGEFGHWMTQSGEYRNVCDGFDFVYGKILTAEYHPFKHWSKILEICTTHRRSINLNNPPICDAGYENVLAACSFFDIHLTETQIKAEELNRVKSILAKPKQERMEAIYEVIQYARHDGEFRNLLKNWTLIVKVCNQLYKDKRANIDHGSNEYQICRILLVPELAN